MVANGSFCEENGLGTKHVESSVERKTKESQKVFWVGKKVNIGMTHGQEGDDN